MVIMMGETPRFRKLDRNNQIEGLRGLAIIIIVSYHVFCRYSQIYLSKDIIWMRFWGTFGVGIFFMISCYYMINLSFQDDFSFVEYLKRKLIRLWPCYLISITVTFILVTIFYLPGRMTTWKDFALNILWINGFIGTPYVDGAHWYLTTLISFTFILGLIRKLKIQNKVISYFAWMMLGEIVVYLNMDIIGMMVGKYYIGYACISIALKQILQKKQNVMKWYILIIVSLLNIGLHIGIVALCELFIIVPVFVLCINKKLIFMSNTVFRGLAIISYPLYLIHQNIAFIIEYKLTNAIGSYSILFGIMAMAIVVVLAIVIYVTVEKPIQGLIKRKL